MGAAASMAAVAEGSACGLGDLPESCVASLLVHLDPPEICRLAALNRAFRGAAAADPVWETKLPENHQLLLQRAEEGKEMRPMSKKEAYARLCRSNPFDGGQKVFWLEKYKAGICMSISSKALSITGIKDRRYWKYIPTEESRFQAVAYLQQIWWFEVEGKVDFCFPPGTYSLYFRLQLGKTYRRFGRRICNSENIHGWEAKPVQFHISTSDGQRAQTQCYLGEPGNWVYYHAGDFLVSAHHVSTKVKFSMVQIDCTHTKGGLCLDSVLICPNFYRPEKSDEYILSKV